MDHNQIFVLALANVPTMITVLIGILISNAGMDTLNLRMTSIEGRLASIENRLTNLDHKLDDLDNRFTRIEAQGR